jgi:hypothetical protein
MVTLEGLTPGTCPVRPTFANGFVYSTDVTFVLNDGGAGCPKGSPSAVFAIRDDYTVNNPSSTCIEAGAVGGE